MIHELVNSDYNLQCVSVTREQHRTEAQKITNFDVVRRCLLALARLCGVFYFYLFILIREHIFGRFLFAICSRSTQLVLALFFLLFAFATSSSACSYSPVDTMY